MGAEEYSWFMNQRELRRHCIMGTDYYVTNEHIIRPDGQSIGRPATCTAITSSPANISIVTKCPSCTPETNRVANFAV